MRLDAAASSTAGVVLVRFQYAATGSGTWTDICTATTAPYTCLWDTSTLADGSYDLRAQLLDGTGRLTSSTVVGARTVVNAAPPGPVAPDVQTSNGGSTAGLIETGDSITFTYSCQVDLRTVRQGWAGGPTPVVLRVRDVAETETLTVVGANLGVVNLNGNYLKKDRTLDIEATMTAGSVTAGGQVRSIVTVTLGHLPSGSNGALETVTTPTTLTWTPSSTVKDLAGQGCTSARVTESGPPDVDF